MKWFKHETDSHTNLKLQSVVDAFGLEGYGYYWACVELIGLQGDAFKVKSSKNWKVYLKKMLNIDTEKQEKILTLFGQLNLISEKSLKNGDLFIPKLGERADDYTNKVRRKSVHDTDNIPLEEKRIEEKKTEQIREDGLGLIPAPKEVSLKFFSQESEQDSIVSLLVQKGVSEQAARGEIVKFVDYWTELNPSGTRQKWQMQKTFEVKRRLATWFSRSRDFSGINKSKVQFI